MATNPFSMYGLPDNFSIGLMPFDPATGPRQPINMGTAPPPLARYGGFYNPNLSYGSGHNLYDSPFVRDFLSPEVPRGEYEKLLTAAGGAGNDRKGQFLRSLYDRTQAGYQAAVLNNPELSYRDYLQKFVTPQGLAAQWQAQTASQRGLNPASRTTMIRW